MGIMFVLGMVFLVIVVPLWLLLHYLTRWRANRGLSKEDTKMLEEIWQSVNKMETRINTLETILNADHPDWKNKV